jgi:carbon-monoxide dehydrogenase catalytic subunit
MKKANGDGDLGRGAIAQNLADMGITTVHERHLEQEPRCKFGSQGLCCRHCYMGPCRIVPSGKKGKHTGVCGATADTIAARSFVRAIAAGCSAHAEHSRDVVETFLLAARGEAPGYGIRDEEKLHALARDMGISTDGRGVTDVALEVGRTALSEFGKPEGVQVLLSRAPKKRQELWSRLGVSPRAVDREVVEAMHRSHVGVDQDYRNLMLQGIRCSLADGWGCSMLATELQDILFGTPVPLQSEVGLGVLDPEQVNLLVHGHDPLLAEMLVDAAGDPELLELAQRQGAGGINLAGICCTANEMLMRRGIPVAGSFMQQELAIGTGLVDGMVVDVQCVMQALTSLAARFHTRLMTTSDQARMEGAQHIPFDHRDAPQSARRIVRAAVENFQNRRENPLRSSECTPLVAGFTHESIRFMLGGTLRSSYAPLNDNIINGRILGLAGVVGCSNPKVPHDQSTAELTRELIRNNVLVLQTGCAALSGAERGLMVPQAADEAGDGLREVCAAVGMPPVLHCGACVDNSRLLTAASGVVAQGGLGEDISDLPLAGVAPGWMSEKAIAIGQYFVSSGVYTLFGVGLPVEGATAFTDFLTSGIAGQLGASWDIEHDPTKLAGRIIDHINGRREALGINLRRERKLFDMKERRQINV